MENKLFRKVALDRLSSPEQLDEMLKITSPKGWLALAALGGMIIALVVWGILGSIPLTVTGRGIMTRSGALTPVVAPAAGVISYVVEIGQMVGKDEPIAVIATENGVMPVQSAVAGRVLRLLANEGATVTTDMPVANLETIDETANPLEVVLYISPVDGTRIRPGMEVQIAPITVRREEFGYLLGRVKAVSETPASVQRILRQVENQQFAEEVSIDGAPIEIRVELIPNTANTSGYDWSSSVGPDFKLQSGTYIDAIVTIGARRPISLVFGKMVLP
jgi:multidrug efflux pump subunit AcrA (membrane-fusion protein)